MPITLVEINDFLRDYAAIISIISFIFGLVIGNWQALGRDRKKEFLAVSTPIHEVLANQCTRDGNDIFGSPVSDKELLRLRSYYFYGTWRNRIKSMSYDRAVHEYKNCGKVEFTYDENNYPSHIYPDTRKYRDSIKNLLKYAPVK